MLYASHNSVMVCKPRSHSKINRILSSTTLLAFQGILLFYTPRQPQCQECPRFNLSAISPVCTHAYPGLPSLCRDSGFYSIFVPNHVMGILFWCLLQPRKTGGRDQ